jgi:hypothetical protein
MKRVMRERLAERIGTERVRRVIGPDWPSLAGEIVDQVCGELGIQECSASQSIDPRLLHEDGAGYRQHMERAVRRAIGQHIADNSVEQVVTTTPRSPDVLQQGRMEMRTLIITRMPGEER